MDKNILAVLMLCITLAAAQKECKRSWKKMGCFKDNGQSRVFPQELANNRDPHNPAYTGSLLRWDRFPQSLHGLACECQEKALAKGHKYFALQFWGECWSGPTEQFFSEGVSAKCVSNAFGNCDQANGDQECVGLEFTNYVYQVTGEKAKDSGPPAQDGVWGEWNAWSTCDQKCGGGQRSAVRECNSPAPANGGKECEGESERGEACNEEECEQVCNKQVEIGVMMDASSSVTKPNYDKMKTFFQQLTDQFIVSDGQVHFGGIHYSGRAGLDFRISDKTYWSPKALKAKIATIPYPQGGTRTDRALQMARDEFFCSACGIRPAASKVLVIVTDGKSGGPTSMEDATKPLKDEGVHIIAIGVSAFTDQAQLKQLASSDDDVINISDFKYMQDKLNLVLKKSCPK